MTRVACAASRSNAGAPKRRSSSAPRPSNETSTTRLAGPLVVNRGGAGGAAGAGTGGGGAGAAQAKRTKRQKAEGRRQNACASDFCLLPSAFCLLLSAFCIRPYL